MSSVTKLNRLISEAIEAEKKGDNLLASFLFQSALKIALDKGTKDQVKLCKLSAINNMKAALNTEQLKTVTTSVNLSSKDNERIQSISAWILGIELLSDSLRVIAMHRCFNLNTKAIEKHARESLPVALAITQTIPVDENGNTIRGGGDWIGLWFNQVYELQCRFITIHFTCRVLIDLMNSPKRSNRLSAKNLKVYFQQTWLFKKSQLGLINIGVDHYFKRDYVSCLHIWVPQFEWIFMHLSERLWIDITAVERVVWNDVTSTRTKTLSDRYLESAEFRWTWGDDFCQQINFLLFSPMGYRLRHKIAHGEITPSECDFYMATLVLQLYLHIGAYLKSRPLN